MILGIIMSLQKRKVKFETRVKLNHNPELPSGLNSLTKPLAISLISCINSSYFPLEDEISTDGRTADELAVSMAILRLENAAPWFPALYASP